MTAGQFIRGSIVGIAFIGIVLGVTAGPGQSQPLRIPAFEHGRLVCAKNVNRALRANGKATTGSAAARSFLRFPRVAVPRPGDIAVCSRGAHGGHVKLVWSVKGGVVTYLNPSSRAQAWRLTTRSCARFIAYVRAPS